MNKALFLSTLKSKYKFILVCTFAMVMYAVIIISMFDPTNAESSSKLVEAMPEGFAKAFGFDIIDPGLTSFVGTTMYSMPYMLFMMVFALVTANSLIAHSVDRGSMACYLATPVSRTKVAATQACVLVVGQLIMAILLTVFSIIASAGIAGGDALDIASFIKLNLSGFLLFFVVGSISFLFSCMFNNEKTSIAWSTGITLAFYVINAVSNMKSDLTWLHNITVFGAFNPVKIVNGSFEILLPSIGFAAGGLLLYGISIYIFNKRDLSL